MTRSVQATLPARSLSSGSAGAGFAAALAASAREVRGWIAAACDARVPAHARDSIRTQRLMRSW